MSLCRVRLLFFNSLSLYSSSILTVKSTLLQMPWLFLVGTVKGRTPSGLGRISDQIENVGILTVFLIQAFQKKILTHHQMKMPDMFPLEINEKPVVLINHNQNTTTSQLSEGLLFTTIGHSKLKISFVFRHGNSYNSGVLLKISRFSPPFSSSILHYQCMDNLIVVFIHFQIHNITFLIH